MKNKSFEKVVTKGLSKAKYMYYDTSKRDLFNVLRVYKGLQPKLETFIFDTGEERTLVNVNGTIPILYKSATYNIPVCFWLLQDYPNAPPMGFVQPTNDMQIKSSTSVDSNGKISLPYICEWNPPDSSLLDLIQVCILVFGQSPPVFSKAKTTTPSSSSSSSSNPAQIVVTTQDSTESSQSRISRQYSIETEQRQSREASNDDNDDDLITDEHVRASLLSACEETMRDRLEEEFMRTKAEVQSLHSTNKELLDGQEKINDILTSIGSKILEVDEHRRKLDQKAAEMEDTIEKLDALDLKVEDADDFVTVSGGALHVQILDAFAVDAAIEDAIYSLGEALRAGRLECSDYLKKVRNLSRKQFLQRVVMQKCEQRVKMEAEEKRFERSDSTVSSSSQQQQQ